MNFLLGVQNLSDNTMKETCLYVALSPLAPGLLHKTGTLMLVIGTEEINKQRRMVQGRLDAGNSHHVEDGT